MMDAMIKSAILFAVVAIATRLLKRRSPAALRHLLWSFAIVGALTIPLLSQVSPLRLAVLPPATSVATVIPSREPTVGSAKAPTSTPANASGDRESANPQTVSDQGPAASTDAATDAPNLPIAWPAVLGMVWVLGVVILLGRLIAGIVVVQRIAARSQDITDAAWQADVDRAILVSGVRRPVEVRMSDDTPVPYTCGLTRPTIVLPKSAGAWSAERRDAVLLHELAHISRGDLQMNIVSHVMRALYWPNPLAWLAANGLRFEGERACDDAVLRTGARASDYADHLLDIVKSVGRPIPNVALAMARSSDFEGRLLAILEPGVPRTRLGRGRTAAIAAVFVIALVPLSALTSSSSLSASTPPTDMTAIQSPESTVEKSNDVALSPSSLGVNSAKGTDSTPKLQSLRFAQHGIAATNKEPLPQSSGTVAALAEALGDATAAVRLAAVNSLAAIQDPAAIAALAKAMKEDTDARVREAAAWALGEIDDNRAVPHLLEALKGERVAKVRVKIVESLGNIDDPSAVAGVSAVVKDPSREVRRAAVEALSEFEDQAATPVLIGMIRDEDVEVRRQVAQALGSLEDASAMDALITMARDPDSEVRAYAIEALHHYDNTKLVPVFVAALKDSSAHVREHAADALGNIEDLKAAPRPLIDALADPNREVRRSAAESLGSIGDEAAVPGLKKLVGDTDTETRRTAVEALKEIGGAEAMQALLVLLKDSDPEIRKLAAEALGRKR